MQIKVVEKILAANDAIAAENRELLEKNGILAINIMGSPGAGKTSLAEQTIIALRSRLSTAVIEGDIATRYDAERLAALDIPVVHIATGGECHLDAPMVKQALLQLDLAAADVVLIENVGNLVCPAEYDLGQGKKVVVSSVPEGHDKVEKYPLMFRLADAVVLNKVDTLDAFDFDVQRFEANLKDLNPRAAFFAVSCRTGQGIDAWTDWIRAQSPLPRAGEG